MKSAERSWTWGGGSGVGSRTHSIALAPLTALHCLHGAHLHPWASLTFTPLHPPSLLHGVKQVKQTSFPSHSTQPGSSVLSATAVTRLVQPWAHETGWCKARCGGHREDSKTRGEKRMLSGLDVFRKFYIVYVAHIIFLTDSTIHLKVSWLVLAFGWTQKGLLRKKFLYIKDQFSVESYSFLLTR